MSAALQQQRRLTAFWRFMFWALFVFAGVALYGSHHVERLCPGERTIEMPLTD